MTWWQRLRRRSELDEQLEKEMRFHLEQHTKDLMAQGYEAGEARRRAKIALGGPEQVKEECRDARGTRWLEDLWQDFRYALRTLRNRPGFAAVALLTLALGTGATTVMFTVINGVLLKPLPYADPDRLVALQEKTDWSTQFGDLWAYSYPNFLDCKREIRSLEMAAWSFGGGTVSEPGAAEFVNGRQVSAELFSMLGVKLMRGRAFLPEEDRPGGTPVAIISHSMWQGRFAGSDGAVGAMLVLNGKHYTITGITPPGFRLNGEELALFTPLGQDTARFMQYRAGHRLRVWARLRPGASRGAAQGELAVVGRRLAEQYPASNKGRTFIADPVQPDVGDVRSTLWLLLGAVSLVLLIACVNVASLMLARAVSRERELAMRVALGAGRGRLVRQCLTESAVLGVAGGVLGILLAAIGIRPFVALWPGSLPRAEEVHLDWRVLVFAIAASLLSGLLFGLAPALRAPARDLELALRAGGRSLVGSSRRLHGSFVVSEIALAVVLLVAAGLLGRTLLQLSSLDPGVNIHNVLTARMALSAATLANAAQTRAAWQDILDRIRRVPGVVAVATVDTVPMREGSNPMGYTTSAAKVPDDKQPLVLANSVSPEYVKVMGLRQLAGRFFTDQDRVGSESVVVIDDVMAREAFGGQDAIGKHVWIGVGPDPARVVGVVGHVRQWGLASDDKARVRAQLYYPFAQVPDTLLRRWSELMSISVRTSIAPLNMIDALQRQVRGPTNDQVLYEVNTIEQLVKDSLSRQRFLLVLFGVFAGLALLLACIGIYGVLAYLTSQRVPEIGVRMALGASGREVLWMVLRQSLTMIAIGVGVGIAAALAAARLLERLVAGMRPTEPGTFAVMVGVLVMAALAASFVPARRASRVDPMRALRQE
ncbi:MAG: ABC transporter permease [Acidobacteriota bacterium]|nr:ABC transporter permease [Acidobacteriota bacterium]